MRDQIDSGLQSIDTIESGQHKLFRMSILLVAVIMLAIGLVLAIVQSKLLESHVLAEHSIPGSLLGHLATAFLIAGLWHAADAYLSRREFVALVRAISLRAASQTESALSGLENKINVLTAHTDDLVLLQKELSILREIQGKEAVSRGVTAVLPGQRDLQGALVSIVNSAEHLLQKTDWSKEGHLACLQEQLETASSNASTLCKFDTNDSDHPFSVGGVEAAHELLITLMKALGRDDQYSALSNLESWVHHNLYRVHSQSEDMLARGVRVFRIFNLLRDSSRLEIDRVREVLEEQIRIAAAYPRLYIVKVLSEADLSRNELDDDRAEIASAQLVFLEKKDQVLRVDIRQPDMSELYISGARQIYLKHRRLFDSLWDVARPLNNESLRETLVELFGEGSGQAAPNPEPEADGNRASHGPAA